MANTTVDAAGHAGIPADASAIMVAVNVIDPGGPGLVGIGAETGESSGGFIFDTGQDTQASFITPLSESGTINVNTWAATDLSVDVIGYFTAPTRTYHYTYDTTGLRASKSLDDGGVAGAGWTKEFTWDTSGGLPLLLAEHRGAQTSYLVYGPQGTPIYQVTAAGDVMYFHQDHLGSTRLVTNANGTTKGTLTYSAYGKPKTNTVPWLQEQPLLGYNGQYHDPETGYIYLRARYLDPATGQFTTRDPLIAVTEEPYGYAGANSANGFDPWGLNHCPEVEGSREIGGECYIMQQPIPGETPQPHAPVPPGTPGPGLDPNGFLPPPDEPPTRGSAPMDIEAWISLGDVLGGAATPAYGGCAMGAVVLCISAPLLEYAGTAASVARALRECSKHPFSAECFKQAGLAGFDAIPIIPGHKFLDSLGKQIAKACFW